MNEPVCDAKDNGCKEIGQVAFNVKCNASDVHHDEKVVCEIKNEGVYDDYKKACAEENQGERKEF